METGRIAETLGAAGHATRLEALRLLSATPDGLPAGEIARRLGVLPNTLSSHLAKLAAADLVVVARSGTVITYALNRSTTAAIAEFVGSL